MTTTMFVPFFSSSPPPRALTPRCTLAESSSFTTINSSISPNDHHSRYTKQSKHSPAARALRDAANPCPSLTSPLSIIRFTYNFRRNAKSRGPFKPRAANKGTTSYQLRQFAEATLGSGSLRKAVKLPEGEDLNEWLAVNSASTTYQILTGGTDKHAVEQSSTSTTRLISSTAPSRSSALRSHVLK